MNDGPKKTAQQIISEIAARRKEKPALPIKVEAAKLKPGPDKNEPQSTVQKPAMAVSGGAMRSESGPDVGEAQNIRGDLDELELRLDDLESRYEARRSLGKGEAASSSNRDAPAEVARRNYKRFLYAAGLATAISLIGTGTCLKFIADDINDDRKTRQAVSDVYRLDPQKVPSAIKRLNPKQQEYAAGVFMDAMNAGHAWSRRNAALALGELRAGDSVPHLIEALDDRNHYTVRISAAKSLIKIGGEKAMKAVETVIQNDPDGRVRREVKEAYERSSNK